MQKFRFNFTKTAQALLLAVLMIPFFSTCKDDKPVEPPEPPKSNATEMTNFKISVTGLTPFDAQLQSDGTTFEFLAPLIDNGAMFDQSRLDGATASFTLSPKATSNPASGATGDFTKNVTYTVTAEDGTTTKTYTVKKRDGTSDKAEIESFTLTVGDEPFEGDVNKDDKTVTVSVHSGAWDGLDGAVPTFTLSLGATASPASDVPQNFTEPVEYEITAHAGNKETWTVTVELEEPEANFETFSLKLGEETFDDGVIDTENHTVTFTIQSTLSLDNPDGWPPKLQIVRSDFLGEAIPTFTCSRGAVVTPATGEPQDFSETVEYTIKAANGEEVTWTVTVNIIPMPANITVFYLYFLEGAMPPDFPVDEENAIRIQSQETTKPMHGLAKIDAENGIITYDLPLMPAWFTADKMKNIYALVDVDWNVYKSMTPGPNDPQDFSKDVVYVLTAADGTEKTWTVKAPKFFMKENWMVDYPGLGITDGGGQNPNSIAIIGDYLSIGRTAGLINKTDGTLSAVELDVTDVWKGNGQTTEPTSAFRTQDYPFFVTNDDAGNMLGCALGAWGTDNFTVYRWTSPTEAPEAVMEFPTKADGTQFGSFGRKLQVLGDIDGKALIISSNVAGADVAKRGEHYMWKVNGGTVDLENPGVVETNIQWGMYGYQVLTPIGTDPVSPYYVGTQGASDTNPTYPNLQYGNPGNFNPIPGPFAPYILPNTAVNGWGNFGYLYHKLFTANGKKMIATFSSSYAYYCFGIFDRSTEGTLVPLVLTTIPWNSDDYANGNNTGSFAMEKVGNDILFYVFATGRAVACYKLVNL